MRLIFFGTAEFAVPSLDAVLAAGHDVLCVVTQPDKPQGRGHQLVASPVKLAALKHGLTVLQPRRVRAESFLDKMRVLQPDALALAAFGQIIPQALLDLPPFGPINAHGSLLPQYRGAAPIQRAIMAGETTTGVTTMWMDATLDTGDMLLEAALPIAPDDTAGTLIPKMAELGARLLVETLSGLQAGTLPRRKQDDSKATFAPAITPEDCVIRWEERGEAICNRIRGVSPKPGAYSEIKGKRVKIWAAQPHLLPAASSPRSANPENDNPENNLLPTPGTVLAIHKSPPGLLVSAGNGTTVLLTEAQPENGKRMSAADWARGQRLVAGERFEGKLDV